MAIVLALLIVGWLVAFALGNQAGFDTPPVEAAVPAQGTANTDAAAYSEPASVS
ncbi:MAG: hypothetical protein AAF703_18060 [Cyanobacteria bacterium P01_D01_bin.105]